MTILRGSCNRILDFLFGAPSDEADEIARRALRLIIATNRPQDEFDLDLLSASYFASAALLIISLNLKHYAFVHDGRGWHESGSMTGNPDSLASAERFIDMAEEYYEEWRSGLSQDPAQPVDPAQSGTGTGVQLDAEDRQ